MAIVFYSFDFVYNLYIPYAQIALASPQRKAMRFPTFLIVK